MLNRALKGTIARMTGRTGRKINAHDLREKLTEKLWNLSDLARVAGVSYRTVKYAAADHPRVYTPAVCKAIADALECSVDEFSEPVGPHRPASKVA